MKIIYLICLFILSLSFSMIAKEKILFHISDSIHIISPNGGEKWEINTICQINWESSGVENVKIEFTTNDSVWTNIIVSISANVENYYWLVPNVPSKFCKVKITSVLDSTISDTSDGFFTIGKFSEVEPNNTKEEANLIELGDSLNASINPVGDIDFYKFYSDAQDTLVISIFNRNNSQLYGYLDVYNEIDSVLISSYFSYYDSLETPFVIPKQGNYYIRFAYNYYYSSQSTKTFKVNLNTYLRQKNQETNKLNKSADQIGDYRICVKKFSPAAPVITGIYSLDTYYNSTLIEVDVNTHGLKTRLKLEYGTGTEYENTVVLSDVTPNLYSNFTLAKLINLESNTFYNLRAIAENDSGIFTSDLVYSFLTPEEPESWEIKSIDSLNDFYFFSDVAFFDAKIGYITGEHYSVKSFNYLNTILKTTDGGNSWTTSFNSDYILRKPFCIDSLHTVVLTDNNNKVIVTTNGGSTWKWKNTGTIEYLTDLFFSNVDNGIIVGSNGTILRTTNGGKNWNTINSGTYSYLYSICFSDSNNGWIGGDYGTILKTTDGGKTWNSQNCGTYNSISDICFVDSLIGFSIDGSGTLYKSSDGGTTWNSQYNGYYYYLNIISFIDKNCGLALGSGQLYFTSDRGENWIPQKSGTNNYLSSLSRSGNNWVVVGYWGTILKSKYSLVSVEKENQSLPVSFEIYQNYPNPFNPTTNFEFRIAKGGLVTLKVYDILGSEVATVVNKELPVGNYKYQWNASALASGVYLYRLKAGDFTSTKKLILMK